MRRIKQYFLNSKLSTKLMMSYLLIVLVAIGVAVGVLSHAATQQFRTAIEKNFYDAAALSARTLSERCTQVVQSANFLSRDTNIMKIVNETNYISEYQKAYDVNYVLEPAIIHVAEQNRLISQVLFYTKGEIRDTRKYIMDLDDYADREWITLSGEPKWSYTEQQFLVSCALIDIWEPQRSATMALVLDTEALFGELLPDIGMNCQVTVTDAEGRKIYENRLPEETKWEETDKEDSMQYAQTIPENGWKINVMGVVGPQNYTWTAASGNLLVLIVLAAGLMLLIGWLFSRSISTRIDRIRREIEAVVESNYEQGITVDAADEIGMICGMVDHLVQKTRTVILEKYQSELNYQNAKMQALQAQIDIHFLYNIFSNLNWRAIGRGDISTSELLTNLSRFYRLSLNNGRIESTLESELQHVELYIQLYRAIHTESEFYVDWNVDSSILRSEMPCMLLQPLVENAFEHGLPPGGLKELKLGISAQYEEEMIVLRISDNGEGISEERKTEILEPFREDNGSGGFGLRNVYKRLWLYFKDDYRMEFENTGGGGTTVVIRLPQNGA